MGRPLWVGALGKQGRTGRRNRLVISPFPRFTGHVGIVTLGKHCVLVKKNEMGKGKEPTERWFPVGARMKQKMASGLEM